MSLAFVVGARSAIADHEILDFRNPNPTTAGQFSSSSSSASFSSRAMDSGTVNTPKTHSSRKPRLVKLRRQFVGREGPGGGGDGAGSGLGDGAGTSGRFGEVQDLLRDWNPFLSGASSEADVRFVLGADGRNDSVAGKKTGGSASSVPADITVAVEKSLPDEMGKLDIGDGSVADSISKDGKAGDRLPTPTGTNAGFVYVSSNIGAAEPVESAEKLIRDEMRRMNIGAGATESVPMTPAGGNGAFVFGAKQHNDATTSSGADKFLRDKVRNLNLESDLASNSILNGSKAKESAGEQAGGFVFGAKQQSDAPGRSTLRAGVPYATGEDRFLPDEMKKLKIDGNLESSSVLKDSKSNEGTKQHASGSAGFVFGAKKQNGANGSLNFTTSVPEATGEKFLHDRLKSLNAERYQTRFGAKVETTSADGFFVFGTKQSEEKCARSSVLGESLEKLLPDEMRKLDIGNAVEHSIKMGSNVNLEGTGLSGGSTSTLPRDKMEFSLGAKFPKEMHSITSSQSTDNSARVEIPLPSRTCKNNIHDELHSTSVVDPDSVPENIFGTKKLSDDAGSVFKGSFSAPSEPNDSILESSGVAAWNYGQNESNKFKVTSSSGKAANVKLKNDEVGEPGTHQESGMPSDIHFEPGKAHPTVRNFSGDSMKNIGGSTFEVYQQPKSLPTPFIFQAGKVDEKLDLQKMRSVAGKDFSEQYKTINVSSSSPLYSLGVGVVRNQDVDASTDKADNRPLFVLTSESSMPSKDPGDPQTSSQESFWSTKENFENEGHPNVIFSSTRGSVLKGTTLRKKRGKAKVSAAGRSKSIPREESFLNNSKSGLSESYSPMDFSPYQEILADNQSSTETSWESTKSIHHSTSVHDINELSGSLNDEGNNDEVEISTGSGSFAEGSSVPGNGTSAHENVFSCAKGINNNAGEMSYSTIELQTNDYCNSSHVTSGLESTVEVGFKFSASPSPQCTLSSVRHKYRRKIHTKGGYDVSFSHGASNHAPALVEHCFPASKNDGNGIVSGDSRKSEASSKKNVFKESVIQQEPFSATAVSIASQKTCESWRLRGNQAYSSGNLREAEEYYTHGVKCISPNETHKSCLRALMLCYSNRAVIRMSFGRMKEALDDCLVACSIDKNFMKVQVRAANCYLSLGQIDEAVEYFKNCLHSGSEPDLNKDLFAEASDGLQKAKHASDYLNRAAELLCLKTSEDVSKALYLITKGLSICPLSENLLKMKAEALLMTRKYDGVIQLCEETLESATKNHGYLQNVNGVDIIKDAHVKFWRWNLIVKSYFHLGRLEKALDMLQKLEKVETFEEKHESSHSNSPGSFAVAVRELLNHKAAGNDAFQAGKHLEAVEHYTAALGCNVESRPFAAICFCNRAAAYQCLGQITDAIADCSLAIALDPHYPKAISRRATLHEIIRDYGHAVADLQRLVTLLEEKAKNNTDQKPQAVNPVTDLKQARARLALMEQETRKETHLDMYMILGIDQSSSAVEIKKAYRKAALRHHPDKAGQFLARTENCDDNFWKEVSDEVNSDADRLFKMIGEAYAVLSDPMKRLQYDDDEEIRIAQNKRGNVRMEGDIHNDNSDSSCRQWQHVWKSYGTPRQRSSESSNYSRYF